MGSQRTRWAVQVRQTLPTTLGALAVLLAGALATPAEGEQLWRRIDDGETFSDVSGRSIEVTPDGRTVVFVQDADTNDLFELYRVPLAGSRAPVLLSGRPLLDPFRVSRIALSPDGSTVVYAAPGEVIDRDDVYSVPIAGGTPIRLSDPPMADGTRFDQYAALVFTRDGERVVYGEYLGTSLYSVPAGGSGPAVDLLAPISGTVYVESFDVDPQGTQLVLEGASTGFLASNVYTVPIGGGPVVPIDPPGSTYSPFPRIDPTGARVVFRADTSGPGRYDLYSAPVQGGPVVRLNDKLPLSGGSIGGFVFDPSGAWVVFVGDQETQGTVELFRVPTAGGPVEKLSDPSDGQFVSPFELEVVPEVDRVVYKVTDDGKTELYSAPFDGAGSPTRISRSLVVGGDVTGFEVTPDGQTVVYRADALVDGVFNLWRTPTIGPPSSSLSRLVSCDQPISDEWAIGPDGERTVALSGDPRRLWSCATFDYLDSTELIDETEFPPGGQVLDWLQAPNGDLVYGADQDADEEYGLYSVSFPIFEDGFESGDTSGWS